MLTLVLIYYRNSLVVFVFVCSHRLNLASLRKSLHVEYESWLVIVNLAMAVKWKTLR